MNERPLKEIMDTSMNRLRDLVDVNTVVGEKIIIDDEKVVIPISKVSFGFGSGGTEFLPKSQNKETQLQNTPFGGGGGGGVTITPVGFLVSDKNGVTLLELSGESTGFEKVINSIPGAVNKISDIFSKKQEK
ncbi:MAG: GerW family sporulation protein [Oscillospiraceae bacterium]|nr:GerW family sporulation protein [Oscillospiraceae bacterium]